MLQRDLVTEYVVVVERSIWYFYILYTHPNVDDIQGFSFMNFKQIALIHILPELPPEVL